MSEDADLQAKIAALSGRISRERQTTSTPPHVPQFQAPPPRWSPYSSRGSYHSKPVAAPKHRNRTLVVNNATKLPQKTDVEMADVNQSPAAGGVTTRDRGHMQWTSSSVYDQKAQEKLKAIEATAEAKRQARDIHQQNKLHKHFYGNQARAPVAPVAAPQETAAREIVLDNKCFRVAADGSKLIRVFDGPNATAESSPKHIKIAGVLFVRSKNGNLLRSGLVRKQREKHSVKSSKLCPSFTSTGTKPPYAQKTGLHRTKAQGSHWATYGGRPQAHRLMLLIGSCSLGNRCRFTHDVNKLAICSDYLRHGQCAAGEENCNLSHEVTPNRVPACTYFLRGGCTKPDCRYAHVHVNASAPVCSAFATLGYCDAGAECPNRHVTECPDYSNTGTCRNKKCRLPHIDRAGNLRKAAAAKANKATTASDDNQSSDVSSDEEDVDQIDSDDVDSDDLDDGMPASGHSHELSQQQDFISFG